MASGLSGLHILNAMDEPQFSDAMLSCCSSPSFATRMNLRRPFETTADVFQSAIDCWAEATEAECLLAFAAHPRIGRAPSRAPAGSTAAASEAARHESWSRDEQGGVDDADRQSLATLNDEYYGRFGFVFLVCATGKTSGEMLAMLQERLANDRATEIAIAAGEQGKITRIRLEKLLKELN